MWPGECAKPSPLQPTLAMSDTGQTFVILRLIVSHPP